jgi:hypothetical protein
MFTSASIAAGPGHGTLTQTADYEFKYDPVPGFKGSDRYTIQICGESNSGAGCSALTYIVDVE